MVAAICWDIGKCWGLIPLNQKVLCALFPKNSNNQTSRLASLDLFAVRLLRSPPLNGTSFISILVSLHTSDNILLVGSLKSFCLIVTVSFLQKVSFLQLILCCVSNFLPHGHIVGNFEISKPYLKLEESQEFCFDNSKLY